jgi:hypothetical protein
MRPTSFRPRIVETCAEENLISPPTIDNRILHIESTFSTHEHFPNDEHAW